MFELSENTYKHKTKLLTLSAVAWFIVITEVLPTNVAALGLDFTSNNVVVGWFLAALTAYFLVVFFVYSAKEFYHYLLPWRIAKRTKNITGNIIGLTEEDIFRDLHEPNNDDGTVSGEWKEIQENRKKEERKLTLFDLKIGNRIYIALEVLLPVIFGVFSLILLVKFLVGPQTIP